MEADSPGAVAHNKTAEMQLQETKKKRSKNRLLQVEEREELFSRLCVEPSEQMCDGFVAVTHCHINLKMMGRLPESSLSSRRINILSGLEI